MNVLTIAPNDLRVYDGTTVRITGVLKYSAPYLNTVYLASKSLNKELESVPNLVWIKLKFFRPLTLLALNYICITSKHAFDSVLVKILTGKSVLETDLIHAHFLLSLPIALGFKKSMKIPVIIDLHGIFELTPHRAFTSFKDWLFVSLSKIVEKKCINDDFIMAFIVPSEELKGYLVRRFGVPAQRVFVINDGVELDFIPDYDEQLIEGIRSRLNLTGKYVATYVGTPSYYHGFYDLIEAFNLAKRSVRNLHLLLIVPDRIRALNILSRLNIDKGDVTIIGNVARREVYRYLYASNFLIIPHRRGTQFDYIPSNKLLDYMASGKLIVGYDLKPMRKLLKDYPLKMFVEPNNPHRLAEAIVEGVRYCDEHIDGKRYIKDYSWDSIARALIKLYRTIVNAS